MQADYHELKVCPLASRSEILIFVHQGQIDVYDGILLDAGDVELLGLDEFIALLSHQIGIWVLNRRAASDYLIRLARSGALPGSNFVAIGEE